MNIELYIASGILESYLLGSSTTEERMEVENLAAEHPEIKSELEQIDTVLNLYSAEYKISPPPYLKEKILAKIENKTEFASTLENVRTLKAEPESGTSNYWAIAASILMFISIVGNIYLIKQTGKVEESLSLINKTSNNLNDSLRIITDNYKQAMNDLAILKDPMYKIVDLKGMKAAPDAKGTVCWCPMERKVYVEIEKLPAPPQGMQYQLWAFVKGKPVNEGMLDMGKGFHRMNDIDKVQAFAVTLEKRGGSPTPKGDMYAMGPISDI